MLKTTQKNVVFPLTSLVRAYHPSQGIFVANAVLSVNTLKPTRGALVAYPPLACPTQAHHTCRLIKLGVKLHAKNITHTQQKYPHNIGLLTCILVWIMKNIPQVCLQILCQWDCISHPWESLTWAATSPVGGQTTFSPLVKKNWSNFYPRNMCCVNVIHC